jgi:hypothetical protein
VFTVDSGATASISGLTIANGYTTGNGGGIYNDGNLTLSDVTLCGNSATGSNSWGGGIYNDDGSMTLTTVNFANNSAYAGGGLFNNAGGTATLTSDNLTSNSAYIGAALFNNVGTVTLSNDTLTGNAATIQGGGVATAGMATFTNDTFSGNSAPNGGGIYNYPDATDVLNNTIVANSPSGGAIFGTVSGQNNLIDDAANSGGLINGVNGNIVGVNPLLAALSNYGGPTQTLALLPGSPAIDAGNTALAVDAQGHRLKTDQRGLPRVVGSAVDIGAFESSGFTLTPAAGNNQTTIVGTAFPIPLLVTVLPKHAGDPVDGGLVTFTAPASGPSATFSPSGQVTITSGAASVVATANDVAGGPYAVTVTASGARPVSFSLTNTATADSAILLQLDVANQGTWKGSYGSGGPNVIANANTYPANAIVIPVGQAPLAGRPAPTITGRSRRTPPPTASPLPSVVPIRTSRALGRPSPLHDRKIAH